MSTQTAAPEASPSANAKSTLFRSIAAILVGTVAGIAVTLLTDALFHAIHVFPPYGQPSANGPLALATAYRSLYGIAASYLVARLAPHKPMQHALLSGVLGFLANLAGLISTWNHTDVFGPHWYPIVLTVTALPCAWIGGKLYAAD